MHDTFIANAWHFYGKCMTLFLSVLKFYLWRNHYRNGKSFVSYFTYSQWMKHLLRNSKSGRRSWIERMRDEKEFEIEEMNVGKGWEWMNIQWQQTGRKVSGRREEIVFSKRISFVPFPSYHFHKKKEVSIPVTQSTCWCSSPWNKSEKWREGRVDHHTLCHYKSNQMKLGKDEVGKREGEYLKETQKERERERS